MLHAGTLFASLLWSQELLLAIITTSCVVKIYFLTIILSRGIKVKKIFHPWSCAVGVLVGSMFGDFAWVLKVIQHSWLPEMPYSIITFFIRIAWGFAVIQYQSISLFMQSLMEKNFKPTMLQKLLFITSSAFALYFFYIAFFDSQLTLEHERELAKQMINNIPLEIRMARYTVLYLLNILIIPGLYTTFEKMRSHKLPKLLRRQLVIFIRYLLCPYIMSEFIQTSYMVFTPLQSYIVPIVSVSTILLIYATYYCMNKVICLRFSNTESLTMPTTSLVTVNTIKTSIDSLGSATSTQELRHIVQAFFNQTYRIPQRYTSLHLRSEHHNTPYTFMPLEQQLEEFLNNISPHTERLIDKTKIINYDDISFDQFYEHSSEFDPILSMLDSISCDIWIPIYIKRKMVAYIIIRRGARGIHDSYSAVELNEMLLFASYLGNAIPILQNHGLESIVQQSQQLRDLVHTKDQEISLLKESMRSCISTKINSIAGIMIYNNRRFTPLNQIVHQLVPIDLNTHIGHPIAQKIRSMVHDVQIYNTIQTALVSVDEHSRLLINACPHLEKRTIIITVTHPDVSDIVSSGRDTIHGSVMWEYLLHLETTHAGKVLNQLLPSNSQLMQELKIELLRIGITNNPLMLHVSPHDAPSFAKAINTISKRSALHTLHIDQKELNHEIGNKIFGTTQRTLTDSHEYPLLDLLSKTDTLYIHNMHLLSAKSQLHLAEYLKTGLYTPFHSEYRIASEVRIICATNKPIATLAQHGDLIPDLYEQLQSTNITIPAPKEVNEEERSHLIDAYWQQMISSKPFNTVLTCNEYDKMKLLKRDFTSISELKQALELLLAEKMKKMNHHVQAATAVSEDSDTQTQSDYILKIADLGKYALKDQELMTTLWNTFKSQNKIAALLKVNRSSVNRRCKEYNLV